MAHKNYTEQDRRYLFAVNMLVLKAGVETHPVFARNPG
jgi:hypothetical protein